MFCYSVNIATFEVKVDSKNIYFLCLFQPSPQIIPVAAVGRANWASLLQCMFLWHPTYQHTDMEATQSTQGIRSCFKWMNDEWVDNWQVCVLGFTKRGSHALLTLMSLLDMDIQNHWNSYLGGKRRQTVQWRCLRCFFKHLLFMPDNFLQLKFVVGVSYGLQIAANSWKIALVGAPVILITTLNEEECR